MNSTTAIAITLVSLIVVAGVGYGVYENLKLHRLSREQMNLARDRNAFLHLVANYLRAPITLLVGATESLSETIETSIAGNLQGIVTSLQTKVSHIMKEVEANPELGAARHRLIIEATNELEADVSALEKLLPALPQADTQVGLLGEGIRRLRQMITTFQLLTKVESLTTLPASQPLDTVGLSGLLTRALHQSSPEIVAKHLSVVTPTQSELYYPGSPELLEYAVSSILANAVAFSPKGGTVTIGATSSPHGMTLSIEDQGVGIDPHHLAHLFNPFMKDDGNDGLKLNHGGLGLSLYLDRIIMEAFGGTISAQSVLEHGTTITLIWPPAPNEAK